MKKGGSKKFKQRIRILKQPGATLVRSGGGVQFVAESGAKILGLGRINSGLCIATILKEDTK